MLPQLQSIIMSSFDGSVNDLYLNLLENQIEDEDQSNFGESEIVSQDIHPKFDSSNIDLNECIDNLEISKPKKKPIYKPHVKWTAAEDLKLREMVGIFGNNNWRELAKQIAGRNSRQCRERWQYYLSPELKVGNWSQEEDALILEKIMIYGKKWKQIVQFFKNRTDAMIKNRYYVLLRQKNKLRKKLVIKQAKSRPKVETSIPVLNVEAIKEINYEEDDVFNDFFYNEDSEKFDQFDDDLTE